jgi:hypothetical protein
MGVETGAKRPGGLTALAVLNFVVGGIWFLFMGLALVGLLFIRTVVKERTKEGTDIVDEPAVALVMTIVLIYIVLSLMLIASGVGYLLQKKFLGKGLGTIYGIASLAIIAIDLTMISKSFTIWTIIVLIYPVLTLLLLHTVFKDDFPY